MTLRIARNPFVIPAPSPPGGGGGTVSGYTVNGTIGSNVGEIAGNSFAGYRSGVNTGPYAIFDPTLGRNLQPSDLPVSTQTAFTDGAVVARQHFIGSHPGLTKPIWTTTGTVTFLQCHFVGTPYNGGSSENQAGYVFGPALGATGTKWIFIDCTIDGGGFSGDDVAPYPSGLGAHALIDGACSYHIERCEMKGAVDIQDQASDSYLGYSWLHGNAHFYFSAGVNTHSDRGQIAAGQCNNLTWEYSTFGTPKSISMVAGNDWTQYEALVNGGMLQFGSTWNPISSGSTTNKGITGLVVRNNYCNDGNYLFNGGMSPGATGNAGHVDGLFTGNRCGPHQRYGPMNGSMKKTAQDGSTFTFDGTNVYDDDFPSGGGVYWGTSGYTKGQVWA